MAMELSLCRDPFHFALDTSLPSALSSTHHREKLTPRLMSVVAIPQPKISIQDEEIIISIPRVFFRPTAEARASRTHAPSQGKKADFSYLLGVLSEVPEFRGKTSVEVQHMLSNIWVEKPSS